eukprot:ctg_465.g171
MSLAANPTAEHASLETSLTAGRCLCPILRLFSGRLPVERAPSAPVRRALPQRGVGGGVRAHLWPVLLLRHSGRTGDGHYRGLALDVLSVQSAGVAVLLAEHGDGVRGRPADRSLRQPQVGGGINAVGAGGPADYDGRGDAAMVLAAAGGSVRVWHRRRVAERVPIHHREPLVCRARAGHGVRFQPDGVAHRQHTEFQHAAVRARRGARESPPSAQAWRYRVDSVEEEEEEATGSMAMELEDGIRETTTASGDAGPSTATSEPPERPQRGSARTPPPRSPLQLLRLPGVAGVRHIHVYGAAAGSLVRSGRLAGHFPADVMRAQHAVVSHPRYAQRARQSGAVPADTAALYADAGAGVQRRVQLTLAVDDAGGAGRIAGHRVGCGAGVAEFRHQHGQHFRGSHRGRFRLRLRHEGVCRGIGGGGGAGGVVELGRLGAPRRPGESGATTGASRRGRTAAPVDCRRSGGGLRAVIRASVCADFAASDRHGAASVLPAIGRG